MEKKQDPKKDGNKKETDPNTPIAKQDKNRRQEAITDLSKTNKGERKNEEREIGKKKLLIRTQRIETLFLQVNKINSNPC